MEKVSEFQNRMSKIYSAFDKKKKKNFLIAI